jgi:hypothetical protein
MYKDMKRKIVIFTNEEYDDFKHNRYHIWKKLLHKDILESNFIVSIDTNRRKIHYIKSRWHDNGVFDLIKVNNYFFECSSVYGYKFSKASDKECLLNLRHEDKSIRYICACKLGIRKKSYFRFMDYVDI